MVPRARDCFGADCGVVDPAPHGCVQQVKEVADLISADVDYEAEALAAYGLSVRDLRNRRCMRDADRVLHMNNHGFWLGQRRFGGPVVKCRQLFGLESSGLGQVADYFDITLDVRDARTIIIRHRDDFRRIHYRCSRCSKVDFLSGVKLTRTSRNQWAVEPLVRK